MFFIWSCAPTVTPPSNHTLTVTTSPETGLEIKMDGVSYTSPKSLEVVISGNQLMMYDVSDPFTPSLIDAKSFGSDPLNCKGVAAD